MFEWLVNYGVKQHTMKYEEVDVNDRLALQDQINDARKNWHSLIELQDEVQGKYVETTSELSRILKALTETSLNEGLRLNALLATNDDYIALEARQKALAAGLSMIKEQAEFYKNDLQILRSVFYNKF